jgi:hypothetical protein
MAQYYKTELESVIHKTFEYFKIVQSAKKKNYILDTIIIIGWFFSPKLKKKNYYCMPVWLKKLNK